MRVGEVLKVSVRSRVMIFCAVKPIGLRRRVRPRVAWPDVVRDKIEDRLQAFSVSRAHQILKVFHRAEMLLDGIFVDRAVAVIVLRRCRVILDDRRKPDRRHAEVAQIIEVFANASQVPAMIRTRLSTGRMCPANSRARRCSDRHQRTGPA